MKKKAILLDAVESYVEWCLQKERMPNLAGFLRHSSMSRRKFNSECAKSKEAAELIEAVFEDEALNAGTKKISAAVLNMYLKSRFGYGEKEEESVEIVSGHSEDDGE